MAMIDENFLKSSFGVRKNIFDKLIFLKEEL